MKVGELTSLLEEGERSEKFLEGRKKRGGDVFFNYFGEGKWNFYDRKMICKINYCENKVKLNNKDNSKKNNVNEIKEII